LHPICLPGEQRTANAYARVVHETRLQTRWIDFDALGHITHAAYPIFLDEARDAYLTATVGPFATWPSVVAHVSIDYTREITHPAPEVVVRTRVAQVGRTSVTFEQEVVAPGGAVAATSRSVVVAWDSEARTARPITDDERAALRR
jgi:acyl-CoA thioester hydrolase